MKKRLLLIFSKVFFLIFILLLPVLLSVFIDSLSVSSNNYIAASTIKSFYSDGTFLVVALTLNSIGIYNYIFSDALPKNNRSVILVLLMGFLLVVMNSMLYMRLRVSLITENNFRYNEIGVQIQNVSFFVSLVWFVIIEYLIDLTKNSK